MAYTQKSKTILIPTWEHAIALWAKGKCFKSIASNIVTNMAERQHILALLRHFLRPAGKERQIANPNVVEFIQYQKQLNQAHAQRNYKLL